LHSRSGLSAHETDWQFLMATTRPNPSRTAISIPCNVLRTTRCRLRNSPQRGDHRSVAPQESHTTSTASQKAEISHHRLGRIEARIGLRMMPTFPRSPLSFRTASFPQYGWKAGFPSGTFPDDQRLKPAPGIRRPPSSLHPPFVHLVVTSIIPYCAGSRTR